MMNVVNVTHIVAPRPLYFGFMKTVKNYELDMSHV